jgi:ABC-type transport system involved in multi-copper enzyme maturation permease subunit
MMLWYKAWCESRTRFCLGALFLTGFSCVTVLYYSRYTSQLRWAGEEPPGYQEYLWRIVYAGGNSLREIFCILILFLGAGGLHKERAGSVAFTLSLPVRRWQLILARSGVGLLEDAALSFVPAVVIAALSPTVHESYSAIQGAQFGLLWMVFGAAIFSLALLCSTLIEGEYSAPLTSLAIFVAYSISTDAPSNVNAMMSGEGLPYFRSTTFELVGLPWTQLALATIIAGILGLRPGGKRAFA